MTSSDTASAAASEPVGKAPEGLKKKPAARRIGLCLISLISGCLVLTIAWYALVQVAGIGKSTPGTQNNDPAWSPDGSQIAFDSDRGSIGYSRIYVMQADGSKVVQLRSNSLIDDFSGLNPGEGFAPSWSPDGQHIAFSSSVYYTILGSSPQVLYEINRDGSHVTRLTASGGGGVEPAWSPDGKLIAFTSSDKSGIWLYHLDGSAETQLTDMPGIERPKWSPDGRRIAFGINFSQDAPDRAGIAVIDANGQNYKKLIDANYNLVLSSPSLAWSPDGHRIAFSSDSGGFWNIHVMDADGSNNVELTQMHCAIRDPAWSPDGSQIAFVAYCNNLAGDTGIYVMHADGSNVTYLTGDAGLCKSGAQVAKCP